jgi:hypothetical protein
MSPLHVVYVVPMVSMHHMAWYLGFWVTCHIKKIKKKKKKKRGTQKLRYHATWCFETTVTMPRIRVTLHSVKKPNRILTKVPSGFICLP